MYCCPCTDYLPHCSDGRSSQPSKQEVSQDSTNLFRDTTDVEGLLLGGVWHLGGAKSRHGLRPGVESAAVVVTPSSSLKAASSESVVLVASSSKLGDCLLSAKIGCWGSLLADLRSCSWRSSPCNLLMVSLDWTSLLWRSLDGKEINMIDVLSARNATAFHLPTDTHPVCPDLHVFTYRKWWSGAAL